MKIVLIEGWRGICHSFAMVNQFQILELLKSPGLSIYHSDLPYYFPRWANTGNEPGFPREMDQSIMAIAKPNTEVFDTVYRIGFPIARSHVPAKRIVNFVVTELGLSEEQFAPGDTATDRFCSGEDLVVTPSNWSKMKLLEYGFPADKVQVVPHGVNSDIYFPLLEPERQSIRHDLGISDEHFVFLNLGCLSPNKGVNHLLTVFKHVRQRYDHARLILKDSSGLYGTTVAKYVDQYMNQNGPLPAEVLDSIFQVPSNLSLAEMRLLYGGADAYVSPYRAEGFNLPVIEAIACGTPVIVTDGGSTDDFCDSNTSLKIASDLVANKDRASAIPGFHLGPRLDSLLVNMERALTGNMMPRESFEYGRKQMVDKFSWKSVTNQLEELF